MSYTPPQRIVIIDDDAAMASIVSGYLKKNGYEVHSIKLDGHELGIISSLKPDLIILDRHLGRFDGHQFLSAIRNLQGLLSVPVLMLTGDARKEEVVKSIELGASDYMSKPFAFEDLLKKVKRLLGERGDHDR